MIKKGQVKLGGSKMGYFLGLFVGKRREFWIRDKFKTQKCDRDS